MSRRCRGQSVDQDRIRHRRRKSEDERTRWFAHRHIRECQDGLQSNLSVVVAKYLLVGQQLFNSPIIVG